MKTLIQLILIGLLIMLFSSCYTSQKATQQVNKANDKFPEIVAKMARDKYPCTDLLKPDTSVIYQDSLVYIDCPDSITNGKDYTDGKVIIKYDTINNVITRTVKVPVTVQSQTKYITKWFEDSSKLFILNQSNQVLQKNNDNLQSDKDKLTKKVANKNKELWIWRIIALALIVWQGIKLWKNLTTIKIKNV